VANWHGVGSARVERASMLHGAYFYTPYNANFVAELKALVPSDLRMWEGNEKRWYVFESFVKQVIDLAQEYWPDIDTDYYHEPAYGSGRGSQNQRQDTNQGQQATWTSNGSTDHDALYVKPNAPKEVITAAYKALAKLYHPDTGGDATRMQTVNMAYERLKKAGKA
jgi:hypothetical protein